MEQQNSLSREQPQYTQTSNSARFPATQTTSSAFSASANPNEDWTKISDLAERRRIQNRIAQRNYRKKLKRRLEDLERKATSTSVSPEPTHAQLVSPTPRKQTTIHHSSNRMARQVSRASKSSSSSSQDQALSPDLFPLDDPFASTTLQEQQLHYLSPPTYSYPSCVPSSDYFAQDFSFSEIPSLSQIYESDFQTDFPHSLPPTLPSMGQTDFLKQDPFSADEEFFNPFGVSYATLAGMDMPSQQMPSGLALRQWSPSSDSWSSTGSRENSPPSMTLPMTPSSTTGSPNVYLFEQGWQ